ncbi:MAG TPA: hypothetical protein EYP10_05275, partial [Armatimonadetes bacterium]|nr:hypothetical protein [Armatimonadota bacterium]
MMSEWNAISVLCCACVVLCAIGNSVASPQWQVRYVRWGNITKEEQKRGWTPHWRIEVKHAEPLEIDVIGDDDGTATGRIFIGRTIEVPERLPLEWRIELEYQTACEGKDRSGSWWLYLFTEDGWQLLGERPENAPTEREIERGMLARLLIEDMIGEDVTQWRKWRSPNMASFLQRFSGGRIVLAFCYAGYHSGSREWGKLRNARVVTSDKPIALHRKPQWRLKTKRTLHTDDEIALARKRCRETEGGQRLLQRILRAVERWMKKSDEEIMWLIPNANVPRAFNVSVRGCPIHGKAIYRHGTYPWRLSFDEPFKIICPIGGEKYPDNDFFAFYRSDFRDKRHLQGRFIDDGWGWVSSDGERYWFVGYACHWWWLRFVIPGVLNLSRAYVLTGDRRYAHKAAVMLFRIAQVYPQMDYTWQSRYGQLTGCTYQGKIVNHIWETGVVRNLAEAYDNIFDTIDGDVELQRIAKMNGEQIRAFIEANLIEEAIDGILNRKIVGNFGMHQCALATLVAVRQHAPLEKFVNFILRETGRGISYEGVHYALFNLIYKDGMPYESSPGYCFLWVTKLIPLAELLRRAGYDLYRHPKMKWLLDAPLNMVCINTFTPTIGDYGSVNSKLACANAPVYRAGYRAYRDARYARHLVRIHGWEVERFRSYDDLFEPLLGDIPEDAQKPQKMHSRIMDGYGLTILNNANDTIAISCYYGVRGGHGHFDQLNIE